MDTHLSETALMADYVIPGTVFLERWDLYPQWATFPAVSLRQPVVPPVFGQKAEYEFVQDLALKLGLTIGGGQFPFSAPYTQYLDDALRAEIGIGLTDLRNLPGATWVPQNYSPRYNKYTVGGFNTPSRKFEFYSEQMAKKGVNPLPEYAPAQDGPTSTQFVRIRQRLGMLLHLVAAEQLRPQRWLVAGNILCRAGSAEARPQMDQGP